MDSKLKVAVRCRPLIVEEGRARKCISIVDDSIVVGEKRFSFEQVFDESKTQKDIYSNCVKSLVDGCFDGYNATVFACNYHLLLANLLIFNNELFV